MGDDTERRSLSNYGIKQKLQNLVLIKLINRRDAHPMRMGYW